MNLYSGKCTAVNHCAVSGEFSLNVIPPISQELFKLVALAIMVFDGFFKRILHKDKKPKQISILIIGLNNSGKSTIVNYFKNTDERRSISTIPTIGFQVEHFENQGVSFTAYDMAGVGRYRNLWEHHFKTCNGIVFVIDSSDRMRLVVVKDELDLLLQHSDLKRRRVPVLFFANKMDSQDALSSVKIAAGLNLEKIENKPWQICSSNAVTGEGLQNGVQWLTAQIRECVQTPPEKEVYE